MRRSISRWVTVTWFIVAALAVVSGCGSSSTTPDDAGADGDATVEADADTDTGPPVVVDSGPIDAEPPPDAGPTCALDVRGALSLPTDTVMDTLRGESLNTTTSCTPDRGTQGPEHVYTLHVEAPTGVILRTTSSTDTVLAIRSICDDPVSEIACNNDALPFDPGDAELRAVLDPGDYYVLVDVHAFGIGGAYTLSVETFEPPPNARCEDALLVTDGTVLTGEDPSTSVPTHIDCGGMHPPLDGNALYYRATVPAAHRILAEVSSPFGPVEVRLLDGCTSSMCIGEFGPGFMGPAMSWVNGGAETDVIIAVAVPMFGMPGPEPITFDLSVRIEPLPAHADCAMARAVTDGSVETGDTTLGDPTPTSCASAPMPPIRGVHYYTASVPAGQALRATARPVGGFFTELGVIVRAGCAGSCLASSGDRPGGPAASAVYLNSTTAPVDVVVGVGNLEFAPPGAFEVTFSLAPVPTNVSCAAATPVSDGSMVTGDTGLGGPDTITCGFGSFNGVLYYSATIPPGHTLGADFTSLEPVEAGILSGCGGTCLSPWMRGPMGTLVTRTNTGTTDLSVIIAVGRPSFTFGGTFTMRVAINPAPMNVTCASATPVVDGTSLTLQDARAGADDLSSRCEPLARGGVLYYRANVPAGETVRASVTPLEGWRPVVRILSSCAATTCLASAVSGPDTAASWTNTGASAVDVIIAAGAHDTMFTGYFRLDVAIGPPPYTESTVPASCDDVSAGTAVAGVIGDDATSARLALPFSVPFFGDSMTQFSVSTNGLVQLYASAGGRPSAAFSNAPIPTTFEPNGMIAALWDDLEGPPGSAVWTHVLGTAPSRRFVVEWSGFRFLGDGGSTLTFQAKVFESGVVELHYCGLTGSDAGRASGGSATIGLEDALGVDGTQHSFDMPGVIGTTNAIRFTPAP